MSPLAKFGLDRPSRSAGHRQQTNKQTNKQTDKHIAFSYVDCFVYFEQYEISSSLLIF